MTKTDARNIVTSYSYDALNRLTPMNSVDPSGMQMNTVCVTTVEGESVATWDSVSQKWLVTSNAGPKQICMQINMGGGVVTPNISRGGGSGGSGNPGAAGNPPLAACESSILGAMNNEFKTQFTSANVTARFQFSTGAPAGQGTLNLNISVPPSSQPTRVSVGRYPVNPATYVLGAGATLHIPPGPGGNESPLTVPFSSSEFTAHLDSAFPYNPIGLLFHLLTDMTSLGGYKPCP